MIGKDDSMQNLGIIPCAISWLFKLINERKEKTGARFSVRISAVEVWGKEENLRDLLSGAVVFRSGGRGVRGVAEFKGRRMPFGGGGLLSCSSAGGSSPPPDCGRRTAVRDTSGTGCLKSRPTGGAAVRFKRKQTYKPIGHQGHRGDGRG